MSDLGDDFRLGFQAGVSACLAVLPAGGLWDDLRARLANLTQVGPGSKSGQPFKSPRDPWTEV